MAAGESGSPCDPTYPGMTFDPLTIFVFLLAISLLGLSKGGLSGIGSLSMPMMFFVMSPPAAAGLILPILMMQDIFSVWLYRGQWDNGNLKLLVPAAAVGIGFGFAVFALLPTAVLFLFLGVVTVLFAARGLLKPPAPAKPSKLVGWILGMVSGLTSTVLHQGGPTFQMYMLPQRLPRNTFVATSVFYFWIVNMIKLPGFIVLGQLTRDGLIAAFAAMPFALLMTWCGKKLVSHISVDRFYVIIHWLLAAVGVKLIVDGVM